MCIDRQASSADKKDAGIKIIVINKPSTEETGKKIKELSEFLSKTWHMPINSK